MDLALLLWAFIPLEIQFSGSLQCYFGLIGLSGVTGASAVPCWSCLGRRRAFSRLGSHMSITGWGYGKAFLPVPLSYLGISGYRRKDLGLQGKISFLDWAAFCSWVPLTNFPLLRWCLQVGKKNLKHGGRGEAFSWLLIVGKAPNNPPCWLRWTYLLLSEGVSSVQGVMNLPESPSVARSSTGK